MRYEGIFKDVKQQDVEVIIDIPDDDVEVVRMDEDDSRIRMMKSPVEIESEIDDLFQVVETKSCTINLLCKDYQGESLFGRNARDVRVNVWKGGQCLFAGYVEPQVFNQPYNHEWDQVTITAYDGLGSLQYYLYGDIMTQDQYIERKAELDTKSIISIIQDHFKNIRNLDLKNNTQSAVFYDQSVTVTGKADAKSIFTDVCLYESLFFGDEFDDLQNADEVIEEILMYYNLHVRQEGLHYFIYHRASIGTNINWAPILGTTSGVNYPYYTRVEDGYLKVGNDYHEKLINLSNTSDIIKGKKLQEVLGDEVLEVNGEYRRYYLVVLPNGQKVKTDKYNVVQRERVLLLEKDNDERVLIQSPTGDYDWTKLKSKTGSNANDKKFRVKQDEYIIARD